MVSDKISLHRLHTMFSLLSLKRAYIVTAGRLVGVVAVPELTKGNVLSKQTGSMIKIFSRNNWCGSKFQ